MNSIYISWVISAIVLILSAGWVGYSAKKNMLGILLDSRGRFSLSQFQVVLWTILIFSLLSGTFIARLLNGVDDPFNITIPDQLLVVMGISIGSTAAATAIKAAKDLDPNVTIKDANNTNPQLSQVYMVEEGKGPDNTVDIAKFQHLWLILIVAGAYMLTAIAVISRLTTPADFNMLPGFDNTMVTLLAISHAGYLAGKLPNKG
jgi:hypothetical protein